ncbi:MAG TPA: lytic transglycosylase domain-containing protein, partial [Dongiaceae bacterium]|nr:lytic transglycosylase domain-containing protein [Dongiaceae bacterium]
RPDLTVAVAKAARQRGAELVEFLFPLRAVPDGDGPEDALVLAVVKQESAFAADAVSPAGARGLMQLMPATAKQVARQIRLNYDKAKLIADPDFNMRLGRAYLDDLLRRFDGSYVLAVAAYNAGPSRVWQWIRELGDPRDERVDTIDWVESIPFGETRNYVQRVMENLQVYRHRLDRRQVALSLEQDLSRKGGGP